MKRSRQVPLVFLGVLGAGTLLTSCSDRRIEAVSAERVYSHNQYIEGVGYFHAPFGEFYSRPMNEYDPNRRLYFIGGQWRPQRLDTHLNVAAPTPAAAELARQAQRRHEVVRSGFGRSGHSHSIYS